MTQPTPTLIPLTSDLLSEVPHGFFTRHGGASSGIYAGLNCGYGSSDQADIVATNRARVAGHMQVDAAHLITVHQTHSARVVTVDAPLGDGPRPEADALVTDRPGLALGVLTADCQPVLLADPQAQVIGAAHAGWRGAFDGVLEATLDAMEALGATRDQVRATIGPSISQSAYEVGEEFFETFHDEDPMNARYFANGAKGKYQFDLPGYGLARLRNAGVAEASWTGHCTYGDPESFYSYRRSCHQQEADYGRLISVIRL